MRAYSLDVQLSVRRPNIRRPLGSLREVAPAPPSQSLRHFEAVALLGGGLIGATSIILFAKGYSTEAYAFGAAGALFGGTLAAIKLLSS